MQFLISAIEESEYLTSRFGHLISEEVTADTHCIWGWVCPRADLDVLQKIRIYRLSG
jgi:hypothetical protein